MLIRSRYIRRPSWAARSGGAGGPAVRLVLGLYAPAQCCYDGAIATNPVLAERFAGFGLKNIELAPFGVARENFSPDFRDENCAANCWRTVGWGRRRRCWSR